MRSVRYHIFVNANSKEDAEDIQLLLAKNGYNSSLSASNKRHTGDRLLKQILNDFFLESTWSNKQIKDWLVKHKYSPHTSSAVVDDLIGLEYIIKTSRGMYLRVK